MINIQIEYKMITTDWSLCDHKPWFIDWIQAGKVETVKVIKIDKNNPSLDQWRIVNGKWILTPCSWQPRIIWNY